MFRTEIIVRNEAAITALRVLKDAQSKNPDPALQEFIDALDEADRIVICQPGESPEDYE
jgi:hypothetical protein